MGFKLKVEGPSAIELGTTSIISVKFGADIPHDSNARSTDLGSTIEITGKILTALDGEAFDSTKQLGLWSLVPAEKADCYRKATIEVIAASQVVRKYTFPNAFVVDYREDYGDMEGVGTFRLIIKQKKDKMSQIAVEGGYRNGEAVKNGPFPARSGQTGSGRGRTREGLLLYSGRFLSGGEQRD